MISTKRVLLLFGLVCAFHLKAQITPGVYLAHSDKVTYELKLNNSYLILSTYEESPAKFLKTLGGFYSLSDGKIAVDLEFNSNYKADGIKTLDIPYTAKKKKLVLQLETKMVFIKVKAMGQDLDGAWLFATRGPDTGQDRRGDKNARKTLKFLKDGRFQWIAYNVDDMKFFGTGGGSFMSQDGNYVEHIEYFSRDNSRVGASLKFDYEVQGNDWHHKGLNSKGEPMYEIWSIR
ncbi:MAG: hypothetical protein AAGA86_03455 [Bacteroidota bacterium]